MTATMEAPAAIDVGEDAPEADASGISLRPYQDQAVAAIFREWESRRSTLLEMATGTGKTIVFGAVAKRITEEKGRTLVLAHRDNLLEQAQDKLAFVGVGSAIEKAEQKARREISKARGDFLHRRDIRCVVGSVASMRGRRLETWPRDYFSHVVIDEGHHATADSYTSIIRHFGSAKVLGVTATPERADGTNLGAIYESLAFSYRMPQAIAEGYLAPVTWSQAPYQVDLRTVNLRGGDLNQGDLEDAITPFIEDMVNFIKYRKDGSPHLGDRKAILFAPGRKSVKQELRPCQAFAKGLSLVGISAEAVWGDCPNRLAILRQFERGEIQVLCNADMLTEGYDDPPTNAVILARPTKSAALFCQMVGRGTRLSPQTGKTDLMVIDFDWLIEKHELCSPYTLVRPPGAEDASAIMAKIIASGEETDILKAADIAEGRAEEERERRRKIEEELKRAKEAADRIKKEREDAMARGRAIAEQKMRERPVTLGVKDRHRGIDFRQFDPFASVSDLAGIGPIAASSDRNPASPVQVKKLVEGFGVPEQEARNLDSAAADKLVKWCFARYQKGLAPIWVARSLVKAGVGKDQAFGLKTREAFELRDRLGLGRQRPS